MLMMVTPPIHDDNPPKHNLSLRHFILLVSEGLGESTSSREAKSIGWRRLDRTGTSLWANMRFFAEHSLTAHVRGRQWVGTAGSDWPTPCRWWTDDLEKTEKPGRIVKGWREEQSRVDKTGCIQGPTSGGMHCISGTWTPLMFDWCCFYFFVKNSLVALLEALCARICSFRFVYIGFCFWNIYIVRTD